MRAMVHRSPFDPVGRGERSRVVAAGDDHISDTGLVPVGQAQFPSGRDVAEAMITGSRFRSATSLRVGASMIASAQPPGRSPSGERVLGGVARSPTWTRPVEVELERPG